MNVTAETQFRIIATDLNAEVSTANFGVYEGCLTAIFESDEVDANAARAFLVGNEIRVYPIHTNSPKDFTEQKAKWIAFLEV